MDGTEIAKGEALFWELAVPLLEQAGVSRSTMMGYPCLRLGGAFFATCDKQGQLVVKLDEPTVDRLLERGQGLPFAPNGRRFREWVAIPYSVSPSADLQVTVTKTPNAAGSTSTLYVWAINVKNKGFMGSAAPISSGITFPVGSLATIANSSVTTPPGVTAATATDLGTRQFVCNISAGTLLPGQTATCRALVTFNAGSWTPTTNALTSTYFDYNSANNQPAIPVVVIS